MLELGLRLGEPLMFRTPTGEKIGSITVCTSGQGYRWLIDLPKEIKVFREPVDARIQHSNKRTFDAGN